jgi:ankyrin repeat protein
VQVKWFLNVKWLDECPEGGLVSHVIALYVQDSHIYFYIVNNNLDVKWNYPDNAGNFPIHYAVANGNIRFISSIVDDSFLLNGTRQISFTDTLAPNGSSVYHAAAISGQYVSLHHLRDSSKKTVPEKKDNNGRGITHYTVLKEFDSIVGSSEIESQTQSLRIFRYLVETSNHSLTAHDGFGRNVLHYTLRNGHYRIMEYLHQHHKSKFYSMLSRDDKEGNNPFEFAFKKFERKGFDMILPENVYFFDIYSLIREEDFPKFMSSWELTLQYLIRKFTAEEYRLYIEPNLNYIIENSPYLLTAVLVHHCNVNVKMLQRLLVESHVNYLTAFTHVVVARHKPLALISCNKPLLSSPLHYALLTHDHIDSVFRFPYLDLDHFLSMTFKGNKKFYACPDENGFNIFHYSLIGGNIQSARILMKANISMTNEYVTLRDVFLMPMFSRLKSKELNYMNCCEHPPNRTQEICTDTFLLLLVNLERKSLNYSFFCNNKARELSLVHLFAANGMARTLAAIAKMFGKEILNCQNSDRFTPFYFGKLFRQYSVVSLVGEYYNFTLPTVQAEEWLIWSMLNQFPQAKASQPLFFFSNSLSLSGFYSRRLLKESMLASSFFNHSCSESVANNYDNILYHPLSSEIPNIISSINFLESLYFNTDIFLCSSDMPLLIHHHNLFQNTLEIMTYLKDYGEEEGLVIETLFEPYLTECSRFYSLFSQLKNRVIEACKTETSVRLKKMKNHRLLVSAKRLYIKLHQLYNKIVATFFIQYGKASKIPVPRSCILLNLRINELGFNVRQGFNPLVAINHTSMYEYKYLNIIKSTIAYKVFKHELVADIQGLESMARRYNMYKANANTDNKNILLKQPFIDLQ